MRHQRDQMTRVFFNIWPFGEMKKLPNGLKNLLKLVLCPMPNKAVEEFAKPLTILPKLQNLPRPGHTGSVPYLPAKQKIKFNLPIFNTFLA